MACRFEVTLSQGERLGVRAAREALDEAERLERQLTVFQETSEVSLVNRRAASEAVRVSPALFDLLRLCRSLYTDTAGAFDITSTSLSRCWGFMKRQGRVPTAQEIEEAKAAVGGNLLHLDQNSRAVRFAKPGVQINLGSIGKGYALDRLQATLRARIRAALLSAGLSSFYALGRGDAAFTAPAVSSAWAVGIRHPLHKDRRLAVMRLSDAAMATSGGEEQFFEHEGRRYSHIIDPRTGYPAAGVLSATVVAPTAAVADALATAFYVGGRTLAERYCSTHTDVLAVMLETGAERPVVFGHNAQCEVEVASD